MTEQRRRMTYEEQRALRERERAGRDGRDYAGERGAASGRAATGERVERVGRDTRVGRYVPREQDYAGERGAVDGRTAASERVERTADRFTIDNYGSRRTGGRTAERTVERGERADRADRTAGRGDSRTSSRTPSHASSRTSARESTRQPARTTTRDQFSRANYGGAAVKRPPVFKIAIVAVLVVAIFLLVQLCSAITPINVTVNGNSYELRGTKTVQAALKTSGLPVNPGDLISLNGNVLEKSAGEPFLADVNGEKTADPDYGLRDGDVVNVTDGEDIVEEYDAVQTPIPFGSTIAGVGAVHKFAAGVEGVLETRTGRQSGEVVEKQIEAPQNTTCTEYNLNTGANKVIAFTFDDGPSEDYTASILEILKENDAKATFFCIGTEVESYPDLVRREVEAGHQVCTHSYDHAEPVGGTDIGLMDAAGQVSEIQRGMQTIADALGIDVSGVSRVVRMPGGNLSEEMVLNLQPYIDYEIGWNVDTQDWTLPGAEALYQAMISAESGDIVLCHDGGGDRSQTVEALRRALPYLKKQGFTFVTMDEILQYPASA